jgi:hypothetical protein
MILWDNNVQSNKICRKIDKELSAAQFPEKKGKLKKVDSHK